MVTLPTNISKNPIHNSLHKFSHHFLVVKHLNFPSHTKPNTNHHNPSERIYNIFNARFTSSSYSSPFQTLLKSSKYYQTSHICYHLCTSSSYSNQLLACCEIRVWDQRSDSFFRNPLYKHYIRAITLHFRIEKRDKAMGEVAKCKQPKP